MTLWTFYHHVFYEYTPKVGEYVVSCPLYNSSYTPTFFSTILRVTNENSIIEDMKSKPIPPEIPVFICLIKPERCFFLFFPYPFFVRNFPPKHLFSSSYDSLIIPSGPQYTPSPVSYK